MTRLKPFRPHGWFAVLAIVSVISGCNREQRAPVAQSQTASPVQATNQPITVTGCLRAGDAPDTHVLTGEKSTTGPQIATYQLQPLEGVRLAELVGKQVEITGVLVAQQELTTRSASQPAGRPKGTSGTPEVSSTTELDFGKLNVQRIRHIDKDCPEERDK